MIAVIEGLRTAPGYALIFLPRCGIIGIRGFPGCHEEVDSTRQGLRAQHALFGVTSLPSETTAYPQACRNNAHKEPEFSAQSLGFSEVVV